MSIPLFICFCCTQCGFKDIFIHILIFFPLRDEAYFPSPWVWVGLGDLLPANRYGRSDGMSPPRLGEWPGQKTSASALGSLSLSVSVSVSRRFLTLRNQLPSCMNSLMKRPMWGETEISYQQPWVYLEADCQPLHVTAALANDMTMSSWETLTQNHTAKQKLGEIINVYCLSCKILG